MDLDSFRDLFKRLSKVGSTYTQADMEDALKLSYASQRFSLDSLKRLASDHRHRPAILVSMADGWGASVTKSVSLLYPGTHTRVTRRGKYRHEFMLERLLYRFVDEDGGAIVGHVFADNGWRFFDQHTASRYPPECNIFPVRIRPFVNLHPQLVCRHSTNRFTHI